MVGVNVLDNCTQRYCSEKLRLVRLVGTKMCGNWVTREMFVPEREEVRKWKG